MSLLEKDDERSEYGVLLYCHGKIFSIEPEIVDLLKLSYLIINKKEPIKVDSINISEKSNPTILSKDRNLPEEFSSKFSVVVDYNCDYTGTGVTESIFNTYTKPLYKNMIKALNPDAWCFITMFDNINPLSALIDPLAKRMQQAEERRINLIKELITDHCKNFSMLFQEITLPDNFKTTYIIFFGGFII
jgi:hypothetical protein